jgi:LPS-assembly lipoprotein
MEHRVLRRVAWILIVALAFVAGCGFHLRGKRMVDIGVARAHVASQSADLTAYELRRLLGFAGIALAATPADAGVTVILTNERFERRVLSVDAATGKVREYEVVFEVQLDVRRPDGSSIVENETVTLERDFTFDETAVLGKFEEEQLLMAEMRIDAAETTLRRLEALELR